MKRLNSYMIPNFMKLLTILGSATDLEGKHRIVAVELGEYILNIIYIGYQSKEVTAVAGYGSQPQEGY